MALFVIGAVAFAQQALACGEKFLIVGRGSRFQRAYVALHPASVLVLNSRLTGRRDLQSRLKLAGHRIQLASNIDQLRQATKEESYDLVLADMSDAAAVQEVLSSTATGAVFLPVIDGSSTPPGPTAGIPYKCPLKHEGASKSRNFLATIDAVMESKLKAKPIDCSSK